MIRVSIIVPCFNSAAFIRDTVASIVAQTLREFEVVFVDDGSTDDTPRIIAELIAKHRDRAMTLCAQPNAGVAAARNRGIAISRGEYILPVDADDLIAPTMTETCARILDTEPTTSIVFTDREDFGEIAGVFSAGRFELARLKYFNQIAYCSLFRRAVWEACGGYRMNVDGFDDWDLWIAAAARGFRGRHVAEPLLRHRRHRTSYLNRLIPEYELLHAKIILNNREVYTVSEVAAAAAYLAERRPAVVLRWSKLIFMHRYPLLPMSGDQAAQAASVLTALPSARAAPALPAPPSAEVGIGASMIASNEDARAAVGKVVRIRGTVQREKLGDTINVGDLSVRCEDFRFPDAVVGLTSTAEGMLAVVRDEPATVSARGEVSQGTEVGGSSFVIRHCVVR